MTSLRAIARCCRPAWEAALGGIYFLAARVLLVVDGGAACRTAPGRACQGDSRPTGRAFPNAAGEREGTPAPGLPSPTHGAVNWHAADGLAACTAAQEARAWRRCLRRLHRLLVPRPRRRCVVGQERHPPSAAPGPTPNTTRLHSRHCHGPRCRIKTALPTAPSTAAAVRLRARRRCALPHPAGPATRCARCEGAGRRPAMCMARVPGSSARRAPPVDRVPALDWQGCALIS